MKRSVRVILGVVVAVVMSACAKSVGGGGGGSYSVESLCQAACDCYASDLTPAKAEAYCSDEAIQGCVDDFENSREYADGLGCSDELDDYTRCLDENAFCDEAGDFASPKCDNDGVAYSSCIDIANQACPYTNDGQCDEPQGTGLCDPGTDFVDCQGGGSGGSGGGSGTSTTSATTSTSAAATTSSAATTSVTTSATTSSGGGSSCDNSGNCGDSTSGCIGCSLQGNCTDEYDTCASSQDCIDFSTCAASCADQACYDQCVNIHPVGSSLYNDLLVCVLCEECYNDCDGAASGCP